MKKKLAVALTGMLALSSLAACSNNEEASKDGKTEIEFLHYKSEAKGTFAFF